MSNLTVVGFIFALMLMSLGSSNSSSHIRTDTRVMKNFCQSQGFENSDRAVYDGEPSFLTWAPGEKESSVFCIDHRHWVCEVKAPENIVHASWSDIFLAYVRSPSPHERMICSDLSTYKPDPEK